MAYLFDLQRLIIAQKPFYEQVIAELRKGKKRTHWMWFIFPQIAALGQSEMSKKFAIQNLQEAVAYLNHNVLGARLVECTGYVNAIGHKKLEDILGYPDDLKFHSCMTLFNAAAPDNATFKYALDRFFIGQLDDATVARLASLRSV